MKLLLTCLATASLLLVACNEEKSAEGTKAPQLDVQKNTMEVKAEPRPADDVLEEASDLKSLLVMKVRRKIGEVFVLKKGIGDAWKNVRSGQKMVEDDRVRTEVESEVVLASMDGSVLQIDEKSDVTLKVADDEKSGKVFWININGGKVYFDIQKQKSAMYKFKTGTAVAAIRGTAGFVGNVKGNTVASLKEGKVDVTNASGKTSRIVQKQTILVDEKGKTRMLNLASSGTQHLSKAIDSLAQEDPGKVESVDVLEKSLKTFDVSYAKRQKAFDKNLKFNTEQISSRIYVPSVTLTARVTPGVIVSVWGESDTVGANGIYSKTFTWADDAYGTKRFLASCGDGSVELPCYMWVTEYVSVEPSAVAEDSAKSEVENGPAKKMNLSVKLGARTEKVHLDLPATSLNSNLKISLAGISTGDLDNLKSIEVRRGGKIVETIGESDLTSLTYEVPIEIERNKIADFEVVVSAKDGKKYRAKKTYEVYCLVSNHSGGKARNSVVPQDQEYERLKQSGGLSKE